MVLRQELVGRRQRHPLGGHVGEERRGDRREVRTPVGDRADRRHPIGQNVELLNMVDADIVGDLFDRREDAMARRLAPRRPLARSPSKAWGDVTSCTRCKSM